MAEFVCSKWKSIIFRSRLKTRRDWARKLPFFLTRLVTLILCRCAGKGRAQNFSLVKYLEPTRLSGCWGPQQLRSLAQAARRLIRHKQGPTRAFTAYVRFPAFF